MDEKALSVVLDNIRNLAAINRKTGSHLSLGTGFLTGKETVRLKNCLKSAVWILAQFRPFQEDMTDISVEYERLRQKYEDKSFRVPASIQKCEAFQGGMAKPYELPWSVFSTVITANARVYACLHHRQDPRCFIGDMREGKSFADIWNSYRKWQVFEEIDVQGCPAFCRNDAINRTLDDLNKHIFHQEFL